MAYLTYDMTRHLFVKLATGTMLEDPFIHQSIYQTHELFGYEIKQQDVDVKTLIPKQEMQPHQGMISTEKDARALQHSTRFKSVELNEKYLFMSVKDNQEANQLDKEITKYNNKDQIDLSQVTAKYEKTQTIKAGLMGHEDDGETALKMTLWETRKLNEHHQSLVKEQLWQQKNLETQMYRQDKRQFLEDSQQVRFKQTEAKRNDVNKQREIKRIIKAEQGNELTKNLSVFLNLNNEERILRQELVDKQQELTAKEKQLKIANVVHQNKVRALKREEREKFVGSFA